MEYQDLAERRTRFASWATEQKRLGLDWPGILPALRARGATIIDCMVIVGEVDRCSDDEAKILVHYSDAWADVRPQNERLHEELHQALEEVWEREYSEQREPPDQTEGR